MLIHGNVTPVTAGSPVEWLRHSLDQEADDWSDLLDRYLEGWAENNLSKISSAMAPGYCFDDPHVGQFSRWSISLYFERVRTRFRERRWMHGLGSRLFPSRVDRPATQLRPAHVLS